MLDYNRPIDKNRDEIILVKYTGCIKNVGELLYRAATSQSNFKSYWLDRYPKFVELSGKSNQEVFSLLAPFTGPEFLKYMAVSFKSFGMRAIDDSIKDYARLRALMNPYIVSVTNMELLLRNLASYDFCKKIYVFDVAFSDASKLFLRDLFSQSKDKVFLLEGDMKSILEEKPEITTIITDSAGEVCEFIESRGPEDEILYKKEFMISALPNVDHSNLNKGKITYMYQKFLSETKERFKCDVTWWQLKYETMFDNINNIQVKLDEK